VPHLVAAVAELVAEAGVGETAGFGALAAGDEAGLEPGEDLAAGGDEGWDATDAMSATPSGAC
jgi:hypothetical protein